MTTSANWPSISTVDWDIDPVQCNLTLATAEYTLEWQTGANYNRSFPTKEPEYVASQSTWSIRPNGIWPRLCINVRLDFFGVTGDLRSASAEKRGSNRNKKNGKTERSSTKIMSCVGPKFKAKRFFRMKRLKQAFVPTTIFAISTSFNLNAFQNPVL